MKNRIYCTLLSLCLCMALTACSDEAPDSSALSRFPSSESVLSADSDASSDSSLAVSSVPQPEPEPEPVTIPVLDTPPCLPSADGTLVLGGNAAVIDASHADEGYFMVNYIGSNHKPRMLVDTPSGVQYRYYLHAGVGYQTFPLTQGSGTYSISILENAGGNSYYFTDSGSFAAEIKDPVGLYLYPNQFVDFTAGSAVISIAKDLADGCENELALVERTYNYVMEHLTYDDYKAATVRSGYVPAVDEIISSGTGICFDYAAVMASILRSQGIPTKLQVGNAYNPGDPANPIYHAWISVYTEESGWVNGVIRFDGKTWRLMDPTFADDADAYVAEYVLNDGNYTIIYEY